MPAARQWIQTQVGAKADFTSACKSAGVSIAQYRTLVAKIIRYCTGDRRPYSTVYSLDYILERDVLKGLKSDANVTAGMACMSVEAPTHSATRRAASRTPPLVARRTYVTESRELGSWHPGM